MEKYLIYLICIIVLWLLYKELTRTENFQTTTTGYQADVEAIRNLSSIATQLMTNNTLTNPGSLKINGILSTNGLDPTNIPTGWGGGLRTYDIYSSGTCALGPDGKDMKVVISSNGNGYFNGDLTTNGKLTTNGDLILGGDNNWIIQTPNDGRKGLYIAPCNKDGVCDWSKQFEIDGNGNVTINGALNVKGGLNMTSDINMNSGKIVMNNNPIMIRSTNDNNHKIQFSSIIDGPEISGCKSVSITTNSSCGNKPNLILGSWTITDKTDEKDCLEFRKNSIINVGRRYLMTAHRTTGEFLEL